MGEAENGERRDTTSPGLRSAISRRIAPTATVQAWYAPCVGAKEEMMGKHDFGDGNGAVKAHRHENPDGSKGGWVAETATVEKGCSIGDNARVFGKAWVCDKARVYGNAEVYGNAQVYDNARVYGNAWVFGNARVYGKAQVYGKAWVYDKTRVYGKAWVCGNARVCENAWVYDKAWVYGNAWVYSKAQVYGNARVYGDARVCGDARVKQTPLCVSGLSYHITLTETHAFVGCDEFSLAKPLTAKDAAASSEPEYAKKHYEQFNRLVKLLREWQAGEGGDND